MHLCTGTWHDLSNFLEEQITLSMVGLRVKKCNTSHAVGQKTLHDCKLHYRTIRETRASLDPSMFEVMHDIDMALYGTLTIGSTVNLNEANCPCSLSRVSCFGGPIDNIFWFEIYRWNLRTFAFWNNLEGFGKWWYFFLQNFSSKTGFPQNNINVPFRSSFAKIFPFLFDKGLAHFYHL